jgi:hypothetical protein
MQMKLHMKQSIYLKAYLLIWGTCSTTFEKGFEDQKIPINYKKCKFDLTMEDVSLLGVCWSLGVGNFCFPDNPVV